MTGEQATPAQFSQLFYVVYWSSWTCDHQLLNGTQDLIDHAKTVGFSRETGEPLDDTGTGETPFS